MERKSTKGLFAGFRKHLFDSIKWGELVYVGILFLVSASVYVFLKENSQ